MWTGVKEMKTSLLMTTEAANCTSSREKRCERWKVGGMQVEVIHWGGKREWGSEGEPRDIAMLFWLDSDGALNLILCWWWRCSARGTGELSAGHRR